jgi:hypothetical protein
MEQKLSSRHVTSTLPVRQDYEGNRETEISILSKIASSMQTLTRQPTFSDSHYFEPLFKIYYQKKNRSPYDESEKSTYLPTFSITKIGALPNSTIGLQTPSNSSIYVEQMNRNAYIYESVSEKLGARIELISPYTVSKGDIFRLSKTIIRIVDITSEEMTISISLNKDNEKYIKIRQNAIIGREEIRYFREVDLRMGVRHAEFRKTTRGWEIISLHSDFIVWKYLATVETMENRVPTKLHLIQFKQTINLCGNKIWIEKIDRSIKP